jgi:hypothetical protein
MPLFSSKFSKGLILSLLCMVPPMYGFSHGDGLRHAFNEVANARTPLDRQTVITHEDADGQYSAVISGASISKTGYVPIHATFSPGNIRPGNMDIDWSRDDAFTRAFHGMEETAVTRVAADPALRALAARPNWTPADRMAWDSGVAAIIAAVVHATPGFDKYRSDVGDNSVPRTRHMNQISADIEQGVYKREFDCEGMSIVKIILQQRVAERFLPAARQTRYFYVSGMVELSLYEDAPGGHAFIVAEKDGMVTGVIEATENSGPYRVPAVPVSFADFAAGRQIVTTDGGAVYGFEFSHEQADRDRVAAGIKPYKIFLEELNEKRRQQLRTGLQPGA